MIWTSQYFSFLLYSFKLLSALIKVRYHWFLVVVISFTMFIFCNHKNLHMFLTFHWLFSLSCHFYFQMFWYSRVCGELALPFVILSRDHAYTHPLLRKSYSLSSHGGDVVYEIETTKCECLTLKMGWWVRKIHSTDLIVN